MTYLLNRKKGEIVKKYEFWIQDQFGNVEIGPIPINAEDETVAKADANRVISILDKNATVRHYLTRINLVRE